MNDANFKYIEDRAQSGYSAGIFVKEQSDTKYELLIASESVPSIFGSPNSFEFDLLQSPNIGKVQGKMTLEDKEIEFLLHRDNIYRLETFKGLLLDFLYLTPDFVGWHFTGTLSYRPNDAGAETLKGTMTITPMSVDNTPILDCRSLILETICFTDVIPAYVESVNATTGKTVTIVCDTADFDITVSFVDEFGEVDTTSATATVTDPTAGAKSGSVVFKKLGAGTKANVIAIVTVSKTGYASATTTIALELTA
jgi:hypothetical protein